MANLSPRADGKVLELRAKAGQAVRAGDVIVAFDLRERQHDLAIAQAQLKVAARRGVGRQRRLQVGEDARGPARQDGAGRWAERAARLRRRGGASALRRAERRREGGVGRPRTSPSRRRRSISSRSRSRRGELRAPFDGVVSSVNFEAGHDRRTPATSSRGIVGGQGLRARIAVPEEAASLLKSRHAKITLDDKTLMATIRPSDAGGGADDARVRHRGERRSAGRDATCCGCGCAGPRRPRLCERFSCPRKGGARGRLRTATGPSSAAR